MPAPRPTCAPPDTGGASLIEVIIALVILTIAGVATHATLILTERLGKQAAAGTETDRVRWETVQAAAAAPACRNVSAPAAIPLVLPGTPERPALTAYIRCGS